MKAINLDGQNEYNIEEVERYDLLINLIDEKRKNPLNYSRL